jgi:type IX secretion system substrate protein
LITSLVAGVWQRWPGLSAGQMVNVIRQAGHQYLRPDYFLGYGVPTYRAIETLLTDPLPEAISLYPNPVQDELNLLMADSRFTGYPISMTLYNALGQKIKDMDIAAAWTTINMTDLAPGLYLVNVSIWQVQKSFRIIKR